MGVVIYKCPNCGGELTFDPSGQHYKCGYCLSVFTRQQMDAFAKEEGTPEDPLPGAEDAGDSGESAAYYSCPNCGAQIITEETTAATFCYYCHHPVVLEGRLSGTFLPDKVLPFWIDRERAVEIFRKKIGAKRFVPKAFFAEEQIEKLTGVYYPYWVYRCSMDGHLEGTGTRTYVYVTGNTEVTETSIYGVSREGKITFDHLTRNALRKTDRALVENVQPFALEHLEPFSMSYLSGFQAEKRDMEKEEFWEDVHGAVQGYAQNLLRDTVSGYSTFTTTDKQFETEQEEWQYVLLPVWVLTYAGRGGKIFYFAMNGQNGNVYGSFPIDWKKLFLVSLGIFASVLAVFLTGGYLL